MSFGESTLAVHIHPAAERAIRGGHPWVYQEAIRKQRHPGRPGDLAVIFDRKDRFLAAGLYDPESPIRIRVLHQGQPEPIDQSWLFARLAAARERRRALIDSPDTNAFRVVHGENDGLPGLVVDRYDRSLVIKVYTAAWLPHLDDVLSALGALIDPLQVVLRLGRSVEGPEKSKPRDRQVLLGGDPVMPVVFRENGLLFEADLLRGQKTGFFLDQRENRARVEQLASGRSVLNVFAYTGGFSLYAARGGARSVTSLDVSPPALAAAKRNFALNRSVTGVASARHEVLQGDAFKLLAEMREIGRTFDMIILDPPSFAKANSEVEGALRAYTRLIRLGIDVLSDGGTLVAASCSSRITSERFHRLVQDTVANARRSMQVHQQTGHASDHPIGFPEGAYLKCIFATVDR
jgi:23S rRNA (cytosine1962-C5)-methyltransferase